MRTHPRFLVRVQTKEPSTKSPDLERLLRFVGRYGGFLLLLLIFGWVAVGFIAGAFVVLCVGAVAAIMVLIIRADRKATERRISDLVQKNQTPIWLTGASIGLSNDSASPPDGAKWWWKERIAFVFVSYLAVRFSVDADTCALIWEDTAPWISSGEGRLKGKHASQILSGLLNNPRYRRLVQSFSSLAALDEEYRFLESLKSEATAQLVTEQRTAQEKASKQSAEASQARFDLQQGERQRPKQSKAAKASWDTLIVPKSLRENLVAYCRILRDYEAYTAAGVKLPKGLLLFEPPGCGKTEIAKTLAAEGGLNFVTLSTSDCKAMWIGWSADRLAKVFKEARENQPSDGSSNLVSLS